MDITNSVGKGGRNLYVDVKLIQTALNLIQNSTFNLANKLEIDGVVGSKTIAAIELFQRVVVGMRNPDGIIDVDGRTISALTATLTKSFDPLSFAAIMAYASKDKLLTYFPLLATKLPHYQVSTPLRMAHFMAQVGHESLSLTYTEELASGDTYEGRVDLGNTQKGDGRRFKGRGLIHLTGRYNYQAYSDYAGINLMQSGNETLIAQIPAYALDVSLWFWEKHDLNSLADKDDILEITRRVNGGYAGLEDRKQYLGRAKLFLV